MVLRLPLRYLGTPCAAAPAAPALGPPLGASGTASPNTEPRRRVDANLHGRPPPPSECAPGTHGGDPDGGSSDTSPPGRRPGRLPVLSARTGPLPPRHALRGSIEVNRGAL